MRSLSRTQKIILAVLAVLDVIVIVGLGAIVVTTTLRMQAQPTPEPTVVATATPEAPATWTPTIPVTAKPDATATLHQHADSHQDALPYKNFHAHDDADTRSHARPYPYRRRRLRFPAGQIAFPAGLGMPTSTSDPVTIWIPKTPLPNRCSTMPTILCAKSMVLP